MGNVSKRLFDAVSEGRLERVSELINTYGLSYSPDWQQGYELLLIAVEKRHSEVVRLLLTRGAKANSKNTNRHDTPLHYAAWRGDLELVEMLLNYGADIESEDEDGLTALYQACLHGCKEVVELLLEHGARVNFATERGYTPLYWAAEGGYLEIVEALLKFGAHVNARDEDMSTALHEASHRGHKDVVKLLLEHGANVTSVIEIGYTSLHWAAEEGYLEVVETLLKFGACVDARDVSGKTALHLASTWRHKEVVELLLEQNAEVDSKTNSGSTPLCITTRKGYLEIVETLLKYGADINISTIDLPGYSPRSLQRHVIKMKTANLYVCKNNLQLIADTEEYSNFQKECEKELTRMKNDKFNNTNISFFNILTKTNSLSAYMRNENIAEALKSEDYRTTFPIYADMLKSNLRKAMERKYLLEQVHPISHPFDKLPCECVEDIFTYLSNKDITVFIVAYKPLWRRGELNL